MLEKNKKNENRKFIYLFKNSFILGCFFVTGISCEREFQMKLSSLFQNSPEVLSMALLAD
jgi:hypothetical protein